MAIKKIAKRRFCGFWSDSLTARVQDLRFAHANRVSVDGARCHVQSHESVLLESAALVQVRADASSQLLN